MLHRQVSSPSLKIAVGAIKSTGSATFSPGLASFNLHQGSALASPHHSPRFLDGCPAAPHTPTTAKSWLELHPQSSFPSPTVIVNHTLPDAPRAAKDQTLQSVKYFPRPVRFELPPIVIEGLPMQQGLAGFASFNFGNVHSVTYRSTSERLPTPYPLREDLDWLELQDEAGFFALSMQEGSDSGSPSSTPGVSTKSSPSLLVAGFPSALCLLKDDPIPVARKFPHTWPHQRSLPHSKSLSALETLANDFVPVKSSALPPSRPSARPMLLCALSSALARRERSKRIRFQALPFAIQPNDDDSWNSSQYHAPTPFPSPRAGRALDPDLMFDSAS